MSKKRGFTLTEILVVIAITSLVFAFVGGTLVFMTEFSGKLIHKSEELTQTQSIETYLRGLLTKDAPESISNLISIPNNGKFTGIVELDDEGNLCYRDEIIFEDTGLKTFYITKSDIVHDGCFVYCCMEYENGTQYEFILGIINTPQSEVE